MKIKQNGGTHLLKENHGITLIALIITIILMLILASIIIYTGGKIIDSAELQNLNTDMLLIQSKVKTISERANFEGNADSYIGEEIDAEALELLNSIGEDSSGYYKLVKESLDAMGLSGINIKKPEVYYLVNYITCEVIYSKGFKLKGIAYYKLSDTKMLNINE